MTKGIVKGAVFAVALFTGSVLLIAIDKKPAPATDIGSAMTCTNGQAMLSATDGGGYDFTYGGDVAEMVNIASQRPDATIVCSES